MALALYVIKRTSSSKSSYNIFTRLLSARITFLYEEVNDAAASLVVARLLYLEALDPDKEIHFYINSPGGSVAAGMAASMSAFLLTAGAKGKRMALPDTEVMIHQPSASAHGHIADMAIHLKRLETIKVRMNQILAENTGKNAEEVTVACELDNFMSVKDANGFGLIDRVCTSASR